MRILNELGAPSRATDESSKGGQAASGQGGYRNIGGCFWVGAKQTMHALVAYEGFLVSCNLPGLL